MIETVDIIMALNNTTLIFNVFSRILLTNPANSLVNYVKIITIEFYVLPFWNIQTADVITLKIYVQPGAKHNEIVGLYNDALKIKIITPAIDGRANAALLKYIAELFDVPRKNIKLKQGDRSRYKTIEVLHSDVNPDALLIHSR